MNTLGLWPPPDNRDGARERVLNADLRAILPKTMIARSQACRGAVADIFVSYTSSDRDWAFWIGQELEKLGHSAHLHDWEISAGGNIMAWKDERHQKADR